MRKTIFSILMFVVFAATTAHAGPFGTNMGDPKEKFSIKLDRGDDMYTLESVPQKHPDFESNYAVISAQYGLVKIMATSQRFNNDSYGNQATGLFDKIYKQIKTKYGKEDEKYDFLQEGSIWKERKYWAKGIEQNERHYTAAWSFNEKKHEDIDLSSIFLSVAADSAGETYIVLIYEYKNYPKYIREKEEKAQDAL